MNRILILALVLTTAAPALAQEDAGVEMVVDAGMVDAGVAAPVPGDTTSLDDPRSFIAIGYKHIKNGEWLQAIGVLLVFLIALLKMFGKKVHELIPDDSWADKPFWFLLETKPGGWLLNFLVTTAGGVGSVYMAGETVTWDLLKPILSLSLTAAALWGLGKDIVEWVKERNAKKAEAAANPPAPGA